MTESALSPAMRAALARRERSTPERPRRLIHGGVEYRAADAGDWVSVVDGRVYLHTPHVDVVMNGAAFPRYAHDGAGGVMLTGNIGSFRCTLERARERYEAIEAWRERVINFPAEVAAADQCMASLLKAIDDAERWRP